jgi:ABC-type hemin transport system ATPase subunit
MLEFEADVPRWLDARDFVRLEQQPNESLSSLGTRVSACLESALEISNVIFVLSARSLSNVEANLIELGRLLVKLLAKRPHARILLCVPANTAEKQRKALLTFTRELAKEEGAQSSVVIGAHFSAKAPLPSATLPFWSNSQHRS